MMGDAESDWSDDDPIAQQAPSKRPTETETTAIRAHELANIRKEFVALRKKFEAIEANFGHMAHEVQWCRGQLESKDGYDAAKTVFAAQSNIRRRGAKAATGKRTTTVQKATKDKRTKRRPPTPEDSPPPSISGDDSQEEEEEEDIVVETRRKKKSQGNKEDATLGNLKDSPPPSVSDNDSQEEEVAGKKKKSQGNAADFLNLEASPTSDNSDGFHLKDGTNIFLKEDLTPETVARMTLADLKATCDYFEVPVKRAKDKTSKSAMRQIVAQFLDPKE